MKALLAALVNMLNIDPVQEQRKRETEYLSKATDLVDLERRQRKLMNSNLKGWV